jgi:hypothetical protein
VILDIAIYIVNPCIEKPAFAALGIHEKLQLPFLLFLHGNKPALRIPLRAHRWLSLTGLISPVPFDPAQHAGTIGIWSIEPQNPFPLVAGGKGRGNPVNIEKNSTKPKDILIRAGEFFDVIVLLYEMFRLVIAGRGVLNAADRTPAIRGYVFIRTELVSGKECSDAEIEKASARP